MIECEFIAGDKAFFEVLFPMNIIGRKVVCMVATALVVCLVCGCGQWGAGRRSDDLASLEGLGRTIGSFVRVVSPEMVRVEGYGLVSGHRETG